MRPLKTLMLVTAVTIGLSFASIASSQTMSFKCQTSVGISAEFKSGKVSSTKMNSGGLEYIFDQIDIAKGKGRMIVGNRIYDITVTEHVGGVNLKWYVDGNLVIATIFGGFDRSLNLTVHPFVESRHMIFFGAPDASQYYGHCMRMDS